MQYNLLQFVFNIVYNGNITNGRRLGEENFSARQRPKRRN